MLHEFLTQNAEEIIARTRAKVATRTTPMPTEEQLKNGVPLLHRQIIDRLRHVGMEGDAIGESATVHGGELLEMSFTVSQVVHGYGDLCQVVTQLAEEKDAPITADEFHTFNRCLDDAMAHSVTEYERRRDSSVSRDGTERLGALAHEMRNRVGTALLSFEVLREGAVSIGGSTGALLGRSLHGLRDLINRPLAGVRLDSGIGRQQRVSVSEILADAEVEASMGARGAGVSLTVTPVAPGIDVEVDPQILGAAISNLVQNAFKFSRRHGHVALRTTATDVRVLIEVEDECGGLPPGEAEDLFRPFEQRGTLRTGLGLGLSISRRGVEAMGGQLRVRDLSGKGCVFAIELPRLPAT